MGAAVPIRDDLPAGELRRLARQERDGRVACRLLGLANVVDGTNRERAARQAGMDSQTLRDWVIRFNAEGIEGLRDRPRSGRPPWLDDGQLAAFKALVLRGPDPERDGVSTWRAEDLCRLVEERFGVSYTENGMLRLLHELGLSWQSYEAGMTPQAIAQFIVNSYVMDGGQTNAAVHHTWPPRFGSVEGFRFEYGYTTKFDIDVHALGAGAVKDGRLYLIYLEAAGKRLFDELRPVAEQIMNSATL